MQAENNNVSLHAKKHLLNIVNFATLYVKALLEDAWVNIW